MSYAIITVGGKQYRVREGERLLVDRVKTDEGKTFSPQLLMLGGNGEPDFESGSAVTARVVGHVLGDKIRIGKYKKRTGYKRHNGFRAHLSQIEIESIGAKTRAAAPKPKAEAKPEAASTAEAPAAPKGMPKDYADLTVAAIAEAAPGWRRPQLEAALEYERANANRKGALAAIESTLAAKEES
jgi:large subunit ribosomal protein L21